MVDNKPNPCQKNKEICTKCNTKCNTILYKTTFRLFEVHKSKLKHSKHPISMHEKALEATNKGYFEGTLNGDEENRTPVRKPIHKNFFHHSFSFNIPSFHRRKAGYGPQ